MFPTLFFVVVPALIILVGAVAALSLSKGPSSDEPQDALPAAPEVVTDMPVARQASPVLFAPLPIQPAGHDLSVDEILNAVEAHVRREHQAAAAFAGNPSVQTLWPN